MTRTELDQADRKLDDIAAQWGRRAGSGDALSELDTDTLIVVGRSLLRHIRENATRELVVDGQWQEETGRLIDRIKTLEAALRPFAEWYRMDGRDGLRLYSDPAYRTAAEVLGVI